MNELIKCYGNIRPTIRSGWVLNQRPVDKLLSDINQITITNLMLFPLSVYRESIGWWLWNRDNMGINLAAHWWVVTPRLVNEDEFGLL